MISTHPELELSAPPADAGVRRRSGRRLPRFAADLSSQLDPIVGCPELTLPADHVARKLLEQVKRIDTSSLEARYSSLGRRGFHPRSVLAVWVYASIIGVHHASKVAERLKTDHAFLLLSGGHRFKATVLRTFRREHGEFFAAAVQQTVALAVAENALDPEKLAVDGMRLQAATSTKSVRTLKRSKKRLAELGEVDRESLPESERATHDVKLAKHRDAVERCEAEGRTSHSVTDPHASLMKFPSGASQPGHRIAATSCGSDTRFVVSVLINAAPNDFGQLEPCVLDAHRALIDAGMPVRDGAPRMQVAADPGYLDERDLTFAADNSSWVDILIHKPKAPVRTVTPGGEVQLGREAFTIHPDGTATCPAGRPMSGPSKLTEGRRSWKGQDCPNCPLKPQCTNGKARTLTQNPELDRVHDAMQTRMAEPGAKARYNQRISTVEPVFAYLEDTMGFRRSSSRTTKTVFAEILLKVLAYNLARLAKGLRLVPADVVGVITEHGVEVLDVSLTTVRHTAAGPPNRSRRARSYSR